MTGSRILLVSGILIAFCALPAWAEGDKSGGCGLGWKIAPKNSLLSSSTRSPINVTFSNTLGMTSGASGCAKHSIVQNEKKAIHYAEANFGQLMIEMAEGRGEHLNGLAMTLGCSAEGASAFGEATQANYSRIFPTSNVSPEEMLNSVQSVLQEAPALQHQCGLIG